MATESQTSKLSEILNYELLVVGEYKLLASAVIASISVIIITLFVSRMFRYTMTHLGDNKLMLNRAQAYMYSRLFHYVSIVICFAIVLAILGVDMSHVALMASALGIGIGLGLQDIVKNFVAGIAIMLERSLKVGDFIELEDDLFGEVKAISMRTTLIKTNDNVDILVPNAELSNSRLINWTHNEKIRRFKIPFSVAYGSDKELVKQAALEAALAVNYTLKGRGKDPSVWFTSFGDSALNFELGVWIGKQQLTRPKRLTSDYLWAIDDAFRKYDITIPFPQMDLYVKQGGIRDEKDA